MKKAITNNNTIAEQVTKLPSVFTRSKWFVNEFSKRFNPNSFAR